MGPGGGLAALKKIILCFCGDSNRDNSSFSARSLATIPAELFRRSGSNGVQVCSGDTWFKSRPGLTLL